LLEEAENTVKNAIEENTYTMKAYEALSDFRMKYRR